METIDLVKVAVPILVSATIAKYTLKWWLRVGMELGFKGRDMNKPGEYYAVEGGGLWVILSSVFGLLCYVALDTYIDGVKGPIPLLSIITTLLLAGLIGYIDDSLGWKKGISPIARVLFTIPISLPLVAVKAGKTRVELPLVGVVDLGLLYSVLVVPVGIVGASNAFNMIAGYNGLEALQGLVLLSMISTLAFIKGIYEVIYVSLPVIASILIFYAWYNRYPAKVFPGNSFTYGLGAFYASLAVYWDMEKYAVLSFTLYFLELLLFLRGLYHGVYKENYARVLSDGTLLPPYNKSYSVTHLAMKAVRAIKGSCRELDVVYFIAGLQLAVCVSSVLIILFTYP
ncbi:MAG: glycosyl transferase family 4 [Desulfurococcaceae archaeon]|nr:glycosyl transferase family 4 [Desulfurococcaceae archaeon]